MATVEIAVTVFPKKLEEVMSKVSNVELENATLQKEIERTSKTHVETKAGLAYDLRETRDDLEMKKRECDALRAKIGELEEGLATLRDEKRRMTRKMRISSFEWLLMPILSLI